MRRRGKVRACVKDKTLAFMGGFAQLQLLYRYLKPMKSPVARELAPAGARSGPKSSGSIHLTQRGAGVGPAAQASGSKLPRHKGYMQH
ncbi:hypothetical protein AO356_07215 [Pseudomonas fluorescens]|uniref:Uncharacterized protein n=1 Tax=Pseudomonas fluorescens TaxID=294 RepID=A0A0N9W5Y6_PSEFL|nr:hypothetical protein AO356_07215 [Pseudomonas fluorescens]